MKWIDDNWKVQEPSLKFNKVNEASNALDRQVQVNDSLIFFENNEALKIFMTCINKLQSVQKVWAGTIFSVLNKYFSSRIFSYIQVYK